MKNKREKNHQFSPCPVGPSTLNFRKELQNPKKSPNVGD